MPKPTNPVLARLLEQRGEQISFIENLLAQVETEERDLVDAERSNLEASRQRIEQLDAQISPLEEWETTRSAHQSAVEQITPSAPARRGHEDRGRERLTIAPREVSYESAGAFMIDMVRSIEYGSRQMADMYDPAAAERVSVALGRAAGDVAPGPHQTTADTPGILPKMIVGQIHNDMDAARPFIQSIGAKDLAGIAGKSFSRPVVTAHPNQGSGKQTEEKAEGTKGEVKISGVDFDKETFLRWMNISRQEIDWTSPAAWDMLIGEMLAVYAEDTEEDAVTKLNAKVTQTEAVVSDDYEGWINALYAAKSQVVTANGTKKARIRRIPNTIYVSHDMDGALGAMIDIHLAGHVNAIGSASLAQFGGELLRTPRVMLPDLPTGTVIYGRKEAAEFYEQRVGLLQAIEPEVLGVKVSYGGYASFGLIDPTLFVKLAQTVNS